MPPSSPRTALVLLALLTACGPDVSITHVSVDADNDGYDESVDCNDAAQSVHPEAAEVCDEVDNDCDGTVDEEPTDGLAAYPDADADGHGAGTPSAVCALAAGTAALGDDCDDAEPLSFPGNVEVCDGVDNDCDGTVDGDASTDLGTWYGDADADGWGDDALVVRACEAPAGYATEGGDCDDGDAAVHPEAPEADCTDPVDYNCDGSTGYADADADGVAACEDCDDTRADRSPLRVEVCDDVDLDEDCDGAADDADDAPTGTTTWTRDQDGDGWAADTGLTLVQCEAPSGYVVPTGDCDDLEATVNPGATEVCDAADTDEDCSGAADDADAGVDAATWSTWYDDDDGDAWGDAASPVSACDAPAGYVGTAGDCDDTDGAVSPDATEVCDAGDTDEDCDGLADDASATGQTSWYADTDGDAWGTAATEVTACDAPAGHVAAVGDCDDGDAAISPDATEVCDGADTDEDCDGLADDADDSVSGQSSYYVDADADGHGDGALVTSCEGAGVATDGDCDDADAAVHPGATESCATPADDDCDGATDALGATGCTDWYADGDADGYGDGAAACWCAAPAGHTGADGDCDDASATVNPSATDACGDGVDADCDGADGTCRSGLYPGSDFSAEWTEETGSTNGGLDVASAGDVDGDGDDDILVGDYTAGSYAGEAWLVPGGEDVLAGGGTLEDYGSFQGTSSWQVGSGIGGVGDLDDDGYDDFLVGSGAGEAWLLYGGPSGFVADATVTSVDDAELSAGGGFGSYLPRSSADLDGDGWLDLVLPDILGLSSTGGRVWIEYGDGSRLSGAVSLTSGPYIVTGTNGTPVGYHDAIDAGDLDGDGLDDLAFGYNWLTTGYNYDGRAYLFYSETTRYSGGTYTSAADCTFAGATFDRMATQVVFLPDIDGDGYEDLALSATTDDDNGTDSGGVYIWTGGASRCSGSKAASSADLELLGDAGDYFGNHLASLDDMDGDGQSDLAVSALYHTSATYGQDGAIFVYSGPLAAGASLTPADADYGWVNDGVYRPWLEVESGDYDGDGLSDLATTRWTSAGYDGLLVFLGGGV